MVKVFFKPYKELLLKERIRSLWTAGVLVESGYEGLNGVPLKSLISNIWPKIANL